MCNLNEKYIRVGKSWQISNHSVVFQIQNLSEKNLAKKFFLFIQISDNLPEILFKNDKPEDVNGLSSFVNLTRKYLLGARLLDIFYNNYHQDYWFCFSRAKSKFFLGIFRQKNLYEINLIDDSKTIYARFSKKGTYTHRKKYEGSLPNKENDHFQSLFQKIFSDFELQSSKLQSDLKEISEFSGNLNISDSQKSVQKKLNRRLKTLKKSLAKCFDDKQLETEKKDLELKAKILASNIYRIAPNSASISVVDDADESNKTFTLCLDPDKSPGKNLSDLYETIKKTYKKIKYNLEKKENLNYQIKEIEDNIFILKSKVLSNLEQNKILTAHKIKITENIFQKKSSNLSYQPFKIFLHPSGAKFLLGKSAEENDKLTKSAKSQDFWFHVVGLSGSHIVVPTKNLKGKKLTHDVKRMACVLAIYYSRLRLDQAGEVYLTQRKDLSKKKGQSPGQWSVNKAETIFVRYDQDELKSFLNMMVE